MANFQTHIGTSSSIGLAIAAGGYYFAGYPPVTCVLAGGLCGIAGMLPDVDSDNGVPLRETMAFLAAVVPLMITQRVGEHLGHPLLEHETRILAVGTMYLFIRFVVAGIIRRTTVHRGMWHSIPAAGIAGLISFYLCGCDVLHLRIFKVAAVVIGYLSHLVLDEMYSVEQKRGRFRVKRSFGTALKFWGPSYLANMTTYGLLLLIGTSVLGEPLVQGNLDSHDQVLQSTQSEVDTPTSSREFRDSPFNRPLLPQATSTGSRDFGDEVRDTVAPYPSLPWSSIRSGVPTTSDGVSTPNYSSDRPTEPLRRDVRR